MPLHRHTNYRIEGDQHLIEIKLREPRQLFNSLDPAPFHEKDLDMVADTAAPAPLYANRNDVGGSA